MGNRSAKFISALAGSIIAGAPLAAVSQNAPSAPSPSVATPATTANAAGDCLGSPKGTAPQGQHWFYRLERSTKRQCWYLRAEGAGKAGTTTQSASSAPQPDSVSTPSVQDAHAEYIAPQNTAQNAQLAPAAAPQAAASTNAESNAQPPAVTSRWPDAPMAAAAPAPASAAPVASDPQPSAKPAASPAPVTLAAAEAPADKPTGSLQMLLLVVGGALALAGLLASIIYRFAGGRVRGHANDRRVNWDHAEPHHEDSRAPWLNAAPAPVPRAERPQPVDFDAARPQAPQLAAFSSAIARVAAQASSVPAETAEADETESEILDESFEIEPPAPQLATDDSHDEAPAVPGENARDEDTIDIDIITAMLERLAKEGPRLTQPSLEADLAELAQTRRGRSAARA